MPHIEPHELRLIMGNIFYFLCVCYLFVEGFLWSVTLDFPVISKLLLHTANKRFFKSKLICRLFSLYDWQYYTQTHEINFRGIVKIDLLYRKCRITGRIEKEVLPSINGIKTFKALTGTDLTINL